MIIHHKKMLYPGQGHGGSRVCHGYTGYKVGIHHAGHNSASQSTIYTHLHTHLFVPRENFKSPGPLAAW